MLCPVHTGSSLHQGFHTKNGLDFLLAHGYGPVGLVRPYLIFLSSSYIYIYIYIYDDDDDDDVGVGIDNNDKASKELKEERSSGYLVGKRRYLVLRGLRKKYIYIYIYIYIKEKVCLLYLSSFFA